jgi:hypothetical protein
VVAAFRGGDSGALIRNLLLASVVCLAVFGLVVGMFSWGRQIWAAPLKITAGSFLAVLLCAPSLYIFSCLAGAEVNLRQVAGVLTGSLCLTALLLLGFAPAAWIFTQSTESLWFMGLLLVVFWCVGLFYGVRFTRNALAALGGERTGHVVVWILIYMLVSLQMTTTLRPILGQSEHFLQKEKKFFVTHWAEMADEDFERTEARR